MIFTRWCMINFRTFVTHSQSAAPHVMQLFSRKPMQKQDAANSFVSHNLHSCQIRSQTLAWMACPSSPSLNGGRLVHAASTAARQDAAAGGAASPADRLRMLRTGPVRSSKLDRRRRGHCVRCSRHPTDRRAATPRPYSRRSWEACPGGFPQADGPCTDAVEGQSRCWGNFTIHFAVLIWAGRAAS
jgi:hypothetical protein